MMVAPSKPLRDRRLEYAICQNRGHEPSGIRSAADPPWEFCRYCETEYRYERVLAERNAPEPAQKGTT